MRRAVILLLVALSACALAMSQQARPSIEIAGFAFSPAERSVSLGDSVAWVNRDDFVHTTSADSGAWSSPELRRGDGFVFVARQPGRFTYHCQAHPSMKGVLVVNP